MQADFSRGFLLHQKGSPSYTTTP